MNRSEFTDAGDPDDARFGWKTPDEGEGGAQGGENDAPPESSEPTLDDLDDETRAKVDAYYSRQAEKQREVLQGAGLDLAPDGMPVVRDFNRFAAWSGLGTPPRQSTAAAPPTPAAVAPSAVEEPLSLDPLTMTGPELEAAIDRRIQKATAPLLQQNQELRGQLQRQSATDALASVREALEQYAPEIAGVVNHPDFAEQYLLQAQQLNPRDLEDPQYRVALAGGILPYLRRSPNTPPNWSASPGPAPNPAVQLRQQQQQPQPPRDEQGRFMEVARNMGNQRNIGQVPQTRGGMAPPAPQDQAYRTTQEFLNKFKQNAPGRVRNKVIGSQDVEAITSLTEDPMRAGQSVDYAEYQEMVRANGVRR